MGFTVKKGSEEGLRRGSQKEVSRRCLQRPLGECTPLGVRPIEEFFRDSLRTFCLLGLRWFPTLEVQPMIMWL